MSIASTLPLTGGVEIPRLGLGTYQMGSGRRTRQAIRAALDCGYRHFDTAAFYENESHIGAAIRQSGVARDRLFVATKLWNSDHGYESAKRAFEKSMRRLDLGYVDLYLIHWPVANHRLESWRALGGILDSGECRAIGVSNYLVGHLDELLTECSVPPSVNQVEFSPFLFQRDLLDYCCARGIRLVAYSPLTKGMRLRHPRLRAVADRYGRTPAQILIRWALQHDLVVIPKSSSPERVRENAAVFDFEIGSEDMAVLDGLDEGLHTSWDPSFQA